MRVRTDILSTGLLGGCAPASANADYITRPGAVENASARYVERALQPQGEDRARRQIHVFTELGRQRAASAENGADDRALGAADHLADHAPEHRTDSRALCVVAAEIDVLRALGQRGAAGEAPVERVVDVALQAGNRLPQVLHLAPGGAEARRLAALAAADLHLEVGHLVPDVVRPVLEFLVARMARRQGG